jgi:Fe2+ or Zn2+ uptake regulation protein
VAQQINTKVSNTAEAIERYLSARPQAAETVEGITRWWLVRQQYEDSLELVQDALDLLVERGEVEKLSLSGGHPIYRKTKHKMQVRTL